MPPTPRIDIPTLTAPITSILTAPDVDLSTISAKRVRKRLCEDPAYAYLGLTAEMLKVEREAVDGVIARVFEEVSRGGGGVVREGGSSGGGGGGKRKREEEEDGEGEGEGEEDGEGGGGGGHEGDEGDEQDEEPSEDVKPHHHHRPPPPKKKKGSKKSVEESDAALARKLSSEINSRSRRGSLNAMAASASASAAGASSSPRKAKRKPKKSPETVDSEDEDDGGDGEGDVVVRKPKKRSTGAKGGFAKEYLLSEPLSAVLGVEKLSRPQVVKKLWEYIRAHQLQNPANKKEIVCDGGLRAVFAVDKIDMFKMNKVLGQHLHEE